MEKGKVRHNIRRRLMVNPPLFFLVSYLIVIAIGGFLLALPISSQSGEFSSLFDSFFVSTSAVCVTGLTPVVSAEYWSVFGQVVILFLIQLGGLGVVTAFAALGLITNQRFSMTNRRLMMEEKGQEGLTGMVKLIRFILASTFVLEALGAVLLSIDFIPRYGLKGIWYAIFHAISAFCNAGFDILGPVSLSAMSANVVVILSISFLIIVAGLGYIVYLDLLGKDGNKRIRFHTKLVLVITAILLITGTIGTYLLERSNPQTLGSMQGEGEKLLNAFFQSVTTRTAGFFSFDQAALTTAGAFLSIGLMFIGGSPGGIAGGIKTTTVAAIMVGTKNEIKGSEDNPIFHRNIARGTVRKAFIIFMSAFVWCFVVVFVLSITEPGISLLDNLYETVSAFATVGLTRNVTSELSHLGQVVISATMLYGKLGPLTVLYALSPHEKKPLTRRAEEKILVG